VKTLALILRLWGPPLLYLGLVYRISMEPIVPVVGIWGVDKLFHAIEYTALGLLLHRATGGRGRLALLVVGITAAACDEWIQSYTPGRDASVGDFLADVVGVWFGIWIGDWFWKRRLVRRLA
jgi:VanZ family protein